MNVVAKPIDERAVPSPRPDAAVDGDHAVQALAALAQDHRLATFRLLIQAGPDGMPAGAIADALDLPASSLSFHLAQLARAGLVAQRRQSRSIIYSADYAAMNRLIAFLMENCCAGSACGVPTIPA